MTPAVPHPIVLISPPGASLSEGMAVIHTEGIQIGSAVFPTEQR